MKDSINKKEVIRTVFDNGVTFFDTADANAPFKCGRIVG